MKLIVNGDDLGYTRGNTYGIFQAYREGILRSTTALANSPYFEDAIRTAQKEYPSLGIGVHLTLTLGKPLLESRTLRDPETGAFFKQKKLWEQNIDYDEVYAEWKAQIDRFIEVSGRKTTHMDSHHHVYEKTPQALAAAARLADEYGLAMRGHGTFAFVSSFSGPSATKDGLIDILAENRERDIELMCHPGWCDLELYRQSSYALERVKELDVLCDPEVMEYIEEHHIELCHYEAK